MNVLIDTHILLWHMDDNSRLKTKYKEIIENEDNEVYVSKASIWEIAIKLSVGKLELERPILEFENYFKRELFREIDLTHRDFDIVSKLPFHHNDPFDRLIISQAINRNFTIITDDPQFKKYPVQLL